MAADEEYGLHFADGESMHIAFFSDWDGSTCLSWFGRMLGVMMGSRDPVCDSLFKVIRLVEAHCCLAIRLMSADAEAVLPNR